MSSIDREDTIKILKDLQKDHLQFCLIPFRQAIERVQALPSADRPQGEWIKDNLGTVICSECKRPRRDNRVNHINFCNSCGARMKGASK